MFWQFAGTSFGITAALIIAGGWILLQYKRDQMHYKVLTLALERGISALPGRVPAWIRSLWQGVVILLLGVGVLVAGALLQMEAVSMKETLTTLPAMGPSPAPPPAPASAPTPGPAAGPLAGPAAGPATGPAPRPVPRFDMPQLERLQRLRLIGIINMSAGGVLILLGIARIGFARLERRYIDDALTTPKPTV